MRRFSTATVTLGLLVGTIMAASPAPLAAPPAGASPGGPLPAASKAARAAAPVVLTGAQLHDWSQAAPVGAAPNPYPSGSQAAPGSPVGDPVRDAHNGRLVVPPDPRNGSGVDVHTIAAFRWAGRRWVEVPVQVDQRYPYFLANGQSSFSAYSGTDEELTYAWDTESWKRTAGFCDATYPAGVGPTPSPSGSHLDDDAEIAFLASDAGPAGPAGTTPSGTDRAKGRYTVRVVDPLHPTAVRYLYLFVKPRGPRFTAANGYVSYRRDANADQWIDEASFAPGDPDGIGQGNRSYGPHLAGPVCVPTPHQSVKRVPRDGVTVSTAAYQWHASGRWVIRSLPGGRPRPSRAVRAQPAQPLEGSGLPNQPRTAARAAGPLDVAGFEDEQTNWEGNSALLGERVGPVRAIREIWGADSGTNVTLTESFYRDAVTYRYHLRVHPIPPDGLYGYWTYNPGVAVRFYGPEQAAGVAIDGRPDPSNLTVATTGTPLATDIFEPTFGFPSILLDWEQVAGRAASGSLVYATEVKSPTSAENPAVTPFYRDDACFDDGTGSAPVPRPWPGLPTTDPRVQAGYSAENGGTPYAALPCTARNGLYGAHGFHVLFSGDTDNALTGVPTTEADVQQWQWAVPGRRPANIGAGYAANVTVPLQTVAVRG